MVTGKTQWWKENQRWLVGLIFLAGFLLRLVCLGQIPAGIHQDEAYSGYEAYCLLQTGADSHGYVNPVYFISWGHGMNALYAYLTIPFIEVGGLNVITIRLPQAIIGCLTLPLFYGFLKKIHGRKLALIGLCLLAFNPWHLMLSRWGLEANLVPFFLLLGLYFLMRALQEKECYYIPAFVAFGLTLYCYAIMWLVVPILLVLLLIYAIYYRKVRFSPYLILGVCLMGIIGMPLFLFYLVNNGYLPEIRLPWLSIPQMDSIRESEVSLAHVKENLKYLLHVLIFQRDDMPHNTTPVGIYYYCSIPFLLLGGIKAVCRFVKNIIKRNYEGSDVLVLWAVTAGMVGCMISKVNVNRINCIHLPMIYFTAYGIVLTIRWLRKRGTEVSRWPGRVGMTGIIAIYLMSFGLFGYHYVTERPTDFYYGYEDALSYAESRTDGKIGTVMIRYPLVLMHASMLPQEYLPQMDGAKNFDTVGQFGRYVMEPSAEDMEQDMVYVVPKSFEEEYLTDGFETEYDNGYYAVIAAKVR